MKRILPALPYLGLFALLAISAPPWPDDWDGLGFLAAATRFDMDRFAPHPPGYPVYVALLKAASCVLGGPLRGAYAVAILGGLAAAALAARAATMAWGEEARWPIVIAVLVTPLAWRSMSTVGTEALALALAALGVWAVLAARAAHRGAPLALGLAVGLGLGVRLSWAPLYLPLLLFLPKGVRLRGWLTVLGATLIWLVPLAVIVGPGHLALLIRVQAAGHASRWGGTVVTDPGAGRVLSFARDIFVDGLGADSDPLGIAIVIATLSLALVGLRTKSDWRAPPAVYLALLPYLAWIALGQNLRQQPRHVLPIVVALAVALARATMSSPRARGVGLLLALLVGARTFRDARARKTIPPPGAQLVEYVRALPAPHDVAVFAGPSARFFEPTELADRAENAGSLGDVLVALTRMDALPRRVLVTSELEGIDAPQYPLAPQGAFCRPARIDRRAPCLAVYDWRVPFLGR